MSAVKQADEIIVMDKGTIVEKGTHSTLMNQKDGITKHIELKLYNKSSRVI